MKALGPIFDWIARISGVVGVLILLSGAIQILFGKAIVPVSHIDTIFLAASTCFLITIALFLDNIKHKKD